MKLKIFATILVFVFCVGAASSPKARPVEFLASQSATTQEAISTGPLSLTTADINLTANTLAINYDAVLLCGGTGNALATSFSVSVRVDGVIAKTVPVTVIDSGFINQKLPFSLNAAVNGLSKGVHHVDVFINAGTMTIVIFASTDTPATLTVTQY